MYSSVCFSKYQRVNVHAIHVYTIIIYYNSDAVISIIMIIYVAYELHKPSKHKAHLKTPQTVNPVYDYIQ